MIRCLGLALLVVYCDAHDHPRSPSLVAAAVASPAAFARRHPGLVSPSRKRQTGSIASDYRSWAQENYLLAAAVQAGVLRSVANLVAQLVMVSNNCEEEVRLSTVLSMGALGASVSGLGGASWQRMLERRLGRSVGRGHARHVAMQAAVNLLFWAPLANTVYILGLSMLRGECLASAWEGLTRRFASVMLLELSLFVPYSALAFRTLPLEYRPLASSCVGAAFTVGLSMVCQP